MRPKYSVARCCCKKARAQPPPTTTIPKGITTYRWNANVTDPSFSGPLEFGLTYVVDNRYPTDSAARWTNVQVPQGAIIIAARMGYQPAGVINDFQWHNEFFTSPWYPTFAERTDGANPALAYCRVRGHDDDDSPLPVDKTDLQTRARTTAEQTFNLYFNSTRQGGAGNPVPADWNVGLEGNWPPFGATPDVANIVQEIVNRPTWASGNAMMLIFEDNGTWGRTPFPPASNFAYLRASDSQGGAEADHVLEIQYQT